MFCADFTEPLPIALTQGDMRCVAGLRKWMLSTPTVTRMERVTRIMVNSRYLPGNKVKISVSNLGFLVTQCCPVMVEKSRSKVA